MPSVSALPASPVVRSTAAVSPSLATATSPVVLNDMGTCARTSYSTGISRSSTSPAGSITVSVIVASALPTPLLVYSTGGVRCVLLSVSFIVALPSPVVCDMFHAAR